MAQQTINDQGGLMVLNPIQIADEGIYNTVMDIIESNAHTRAAESFKTLNDEAPDNFIMEAVHSPGNPILVDENHIALLWRDRDDPANPDLMMAVLFELVEREDKTYRKAPCGVIVGDQFQGILQYRCPCCGTNDSGFSMMFFLMNEDGKIEFTTRDSMFTKDSKKRLFQNVDMGVTVNSHQIKHILHHHENFNVQCSHNHGLLPKRLEAQKPIFECK